MGVGLVFVLDSAEVFPVRQGMVVAVVGLYNMARVLWRFNPAVHHPLVTGLTLGMDVLLCLVLVLMTNGLDSPFLIYSLAPILTASLLMDTRSALAVAVAMVLTVPGAYVVSQLGVGDYPWILSGNYLALSVLFTAVCLLIGYLPFLSNLNWQRRVRHESMATERRRLRREVHDNIAQTLAFLSLKVKRAEERASSPGSAISGRDVVEIGSMVERAYLAVRDYLDETYDIGIGEPLETSLAIAVQQWSRDTGLPVQMSLADAQDRLSASAKLQLLQIAREALANVAKHAGPSQIWVAVEYDADELTMRIKDDGAGFSDSQPQGHGLDTMRESRGRGGATERQERGGGGHGDRRGVPPRPGGG
jgi:signal transduction histidine kinase